LKPLPERAVDRIQGVDPGLDLLTGGGGAHRGDGPSLVDPETEGVRRSALTQPSLRGLIGIKRVRDHRHKAQLVENCLL
jgi:hypothetical protein